MGRAKKAIEALAKLAPETATVRRGGQTSEIPVEQMVVGDIAIVRPNERLPADGFVIKGTSAINQAPVTGESIPVDKVPVADAAAARAKPDAVDAESRVFAGTINGGGAIEIELSRRTKLRLQKLGASVLPGHKRPSRKGHSTQHLRIRHALVVI